MQQKRGGANSIEKICATLERAPSKTKFILLLDKNDPCGLDQLLTLNIAGCLIKDNIDHSLPHLIRAVVAGKVLFSRGAINKLISTDNSTLFDHKSIGLTDRELTVAQLMADGWSNSQIAAELSLAEQTVRNKVTRIYAKIGVSSRTEFLLWAHEQAPSES